MIVIENGPEHSSLTRALGLGEEWIDFQIDLLVRHRPVWALEAAIRLRSNRPELLLNLDGVSSLETVDYPDHYDCNIGYFRLQTILKALLAAQDALIEPDQVLLTPEHIFLDPSSGQVRLAIIPVMQKAPPQTPAQLRFEQEFRSLLISLQKAYKLDSGLIEKLTKSSTWLELVKIDEALGNYLQSDLTRGKNNPGESSRLDVDCEGDVLGGDVLGGVALGGVALGGDSLGGVALGGVATGEDLHVPMPVSPDGKAHEQAGRYPDDNKQSGLRGGVILTHRFKRFAKPGSLLLFLAASHGLITFIVLVLLTVSYLGPIMPGFTIIFGNQMAVYYYPALGGLATLLLMFDLVLAGVFQRITCFLLTQKNKLVHWFIEVLHPDTRTSGIPSDHSSVRSSHRFSGSSKTENARANQTPLADPAHQTVLLASMHEIYRLGLLSVGLPGSPEETEGLRAYILVDEFLVGRDDTFCDLPLPVPSVGRRHARITRREGSFFITDLGSKNGTSLDGRRLNKLEEYLLPDRCRIEFADQAFYFSAD
jgi:hypothetical protein